MVNRIIQIVASQSVTEKEDEFNRWYSEVHLPMLFGFKGVKQASWYKCIGEPGDNAKYLAIYEFESEDDLKAFLESPEFAEAVKDFEEKKEAVGFDMKWTASYELLTTLSRK